MSRSYKIERELDDFHKHKLSMILTEKAYGDSRLEQEELDKKKDELVEKNQDLKRDGSISQGMIDKIIGNYKWFVVIIDYFIAYVIVASLSEYIPYIPIPIKTLIAVAVYTTLEFAMNFFTSDPTPPEVSDTKTPFEYDEVYEQEMNQYKKARKKTSLANKVKHAFITVIPLISLATMFEEIGVSFYKAGLEEGSDYARFYLNSDILYIIFKYVGLALLGYLSHYFLIEFGHQIKDARSRLSFDKKLKKLEEAIAKVKKRVSAIEENLVKMVMDYHQKLKMHIARFGKHNLLPSETFSPMLDELYLRVNGYRLTD